MSPDAPRRSRVLALTLLLLAPPSCIRHFHPVVTRPPTLGEELLSLDAARRDGLLTEEEFTARRAQTIEAWKAIGTATVEVPEEDDAP
jgi:hypothetical protein